LASGSLTRADIEAWSTEHLDTAATHWSSTAQAWEEHFTTIHSGMTRPGGTTWDGAGADAAAERSWADLVTVRGAADALHSASAHATTGSGDVAWAKRQALNAIVEAEEDGFTVGQDFSVKDTSMPSLLSDGEDRQSKAKEHAHAIQTAVQQLVDADKQTADRIHGALSPLNGVTFPGHEGDGKHDATMQAVDFGFKRDVPKPPPPPPAGPNRQDIAKVLDQLPSDSRPNIKVVRSQADIDRLWQWMKQNGVENPGRYGGTNGVSVDLPDGTSVGERAAARSTGQSALDVNVPGRGYIKVHINPEKGAEPNIPAPKAPVEAPKVAEPQAPRPAPPPVAEAGPAAKPAPVAEPAPAVKPTPGIGGWGGPSAEPMGPQPVHPPGSINHHFPILGDDNPNENPRDFEGH